DWLVEGLMKLEKVKVVSSQTTKNYLEYAKSDQGEGDNSLFQRLTGAEKIIQGNYYQVGEELVFQVQIIDALSGELDIALPRISKSQDQISSLVNELTSKVLASFVAKDHINTTYLSSEPPDYEAFKVFVSSFDYFGVDDELAMQKLQAAIALDSNFVEPYNTILTIYNNMGNYEAADSMLQLIKKKFPRLSPFRQYFLGYMEALLDRDMESVLKNTDLMVELEPQNMMANYSLGYNYANLNYFQKTISIFERMDTSLLMDYTITSAVASWWNEAYGHCLIKVGRYDDALKILKLMKPEFVNRDNHILRAQIYIYQNKPELLEKMIRDIQKQEKSPLYISEIYHAAAITYGLTGKAEKQKQWAEKALQYSNSQKETDSNTLAESYYYAGEYEKALPLYQEVAVNSSFGSIYYTGKWHYLSRIGCIYARLGKNDKAREIIEQLENIGDPRPYGRYTYGISRILAQLGEIEEASQMTRKAMKEGFPNEYAEFRYGDDIDLLPLRGYEEFDEFLVRE
ncbi:MAG: hypothetical protein KDE26_15755, partial [Bacteroidetes bacterium]|nr:hypothetical protein [Bacteroidota bacterium]